MEEGKKDKNGGEARNKSIEGWIIAHGEKGKK